MYVTVREVIIHFSYMNVKLGEIRKEWLWLAIKFFMVILMKEHGNP
jgi:hypothetical protein